MADSHEPFVIIFGVLVLKTTMIAIVALSLTFDEAPFPILITAAFTVTTVSLLTAFFREDFSLEGINTTSCIAQATRDLTFLKKALKLAIKLSQIVLIQLVILNNLFAFLLVIIVIQAETDHIARDLRLLLALVMG